MGLLETIGVRSRPAARGRHHASRAAIVASGDLVGNTSLGTTGGASGGSRQAWQPEAWNFYDAFGELHYGAQFVGSCLSRIKLRLAYVTDSGDIAPVYDEDGGVREECPVDTADIALATVILDSFRDPLGGTAALFEQIGKNLTVAGECHLLARDLHDDTGQIVARRWEVLSTDELRRRPNCRRDGEGKPLEPEFERVVGGNRPNELIPLECFVLRIYRRHPRFSRLADAPTRPLLDIMEVLVLLGRQLRSTVLSRLAGAGVLWVPSEIDFPDDDTAPEGSEEQDPFVRTLIRQMTAPISDRGAASAVVPLVVRADADLISAVKHMKFDTVDDVVVIAKMTALIQRFAQGMDLPVEVTLGHQSTTFANAVQIDESTFKAHIEPLVNIVCGFLTAGYLWASMGAKRPVDASPDDPVFLPVDDDRITRLRIIGDASDLVTHEDREKNALEALKMVPPLIGYSPGRRALGFEDSDAMDEEELERWIATRQKVAVKETVRADETPAEADALADPTTLPPSQNGAEPQPVGA